MEKAFPMICALSQLRVIEHIAQRQEKRAGCKKKKTNKPLQSLAAPRRAGRKPWQPRAAAWPHIPAAPTPAEHHPCPPFFQPPQKKGKTKKPVNAKHRSSTTPLRALCKHWQQVGEKLKSRQGLVWKQGAGGEGPRAHEDAQTLAVAERANSPRLTMVDEWRPDFSIWGHTFVR